MKRIIFLSFAIAVAGCATVRHAREAQDTRRIPAGERTVTALETGLNSNTVLTLARALNIAGRSHPAIIEARQNLIIAEAQVQEARAGQQPKFGANAGYRRGTSNVQGQPTSSSSKGSYSAGLSADFLLYDFGKTPALIREAQARRLAAEEDLHAAQNDVAFSIRAAFYTLSQNIELMHVAEETVRQFEAHLAQVQSLYEVGRRIKYDITKAQVDLGNAKLSLIDAGNVVKTSRAAMNRALGLAEEPGYQLAESPHEDISSDMGSLLLLAREQQPLLRALNAQAVAASNAVDSVIADLYPSFGLSADLSLSGGHFPLVWNWSGAANATMSLFDGGTRFGKIDEAASQLRIARARQADYEQQIFSDLSQAVAKLDGARERLKLTDLIVKQAQESVDLVGERYRVGLATSIEQTDAQVTLANARAEQVKARFDVLNNVAAIKHTVSEP